MSYMKPSLQSLLQYLNAANSTTYTENDLTFTAPKVVAGTWRDDTTDHNTAIRAMGKEGGKYQGRKVLTYDRLDFASLAYVPGFKIMATGKTTAHQLIDLITHFNGVRLTVDDFEDTPIVDDGNGNLSVVISAKPNSIGWIGSITVPVQPGGIALEEAVATPVLPGLNYPTTSDTDTYGLVYTYGYDFTAYFDDLIDIEAGQPSSGQLDQIVNMLKAVDVSSGKTLWNNTAGNTAWSLEGATITHAGLNESTLPTNQAYKYVIGIQLRADVTIPKGVFYLHFNDPFNPDDF